MLEFCGVVVVDFDVDGYVICVVVMYFSFVGYFCKK